jgi:hypothetical protein
MVAVSHGYNNKVRYVQRSRPEGDDSEWDDSPTSQLRPNIDQTDHNIFVPAKSMEFRQERGHHVEAVVVKGAEVRNL